MEIVGFEPRRNDLARGILIARGAQPLDAARQKQLWAQLATAGVTEGEDDDDGEDDDGSGPPARQWVAAPWLPPSTEQLAAHRAALDALGPAYGIEAVWCFKVETGIDGIAWLEMAAEETREQASAPEPSLTVEQAATASESAQVLYTAPDAPSAGTIAATIAPAPEADERDADEDDDELGADDVALDSHWRAGAPPFEHSVPFPIERYPEIIDDYDWESFGVAIKLAGTAMPGEQTVVNAFFALWLSVYQDERADDFDPFQRADVVHDLRHRSALMWVERFAVPATASDQVHFLLWIIARLHEVIPIAWARFDPVDEATKAHATVNPPDEPFVLAGNPFADRFHRQGEHAALAWAVGQASWSPRELAGMLVEVALEHDPDDPAAAVVAERLLRRAQSFDPRSSAAGYLAIVLIRQRRLPEAIAIARATTIAEVRLLVIGEAAEHASSELGPVLELLDPATAAATEPEELAELTAAVARHAPSHLATMLARLPDDVALVPHLYNSSFQADRPQALAILRRVLALPVPAPDAGEARTAMVMAWNNACIHAHALGDYRLAVELAEGGQRYGDENPYIYHSSACAYAAVGQLDRALDQVSKAIEHDYEHAEKMETDPDLGPLHGEPRFAALFVEWRARRADLN